MALITIEPTSEHPIPYSLEAEKPINFMDELVVAANTVDVQVSLGADLGLDSDDVERQTRLIDEAIKNKKSSALKSPITAFAAAAFLRTYSQQLALDVAGLRSAIANKLMEIANCGDPRYELKALELLGKHSDVGLFTERSEITVNYKNPADLENEIKERVRRLLNASVVGTTEFGGALDDELFALETLPEPPADV
tara:strand:+ start:34 stop:621 length:588 start_codon:yes stop_codon:yes gene_type:complete